MKYCLEFGVKGGAHTDNCILSTIKESSKVAASLVYVLTKNYPDALTNAKEWKVNKRVPRVTWENSTHFVALSILDGIPRGPASAKLWKGI